MLFTIPLKHTGPWELYSALGNTRNSLIAYDSMIHFNHSFMQLRPRVTTTFHFLEYACAVIESSRYNSEGTAHDPCSLLVGLNSVVVENGWRVLCAFGKHNY